MTRRDPDELLPGAEEVSRAYRRAGFTEAPPEHVDRAVLASARQARARPLRGWLGPLALAATIVLSLSVALEIGLLDGGRDVDVLDGPQARRSSEERARASAARSENGPAGGAPAAAERTPASPPRGSPSQAPAEDFASTERAFDSLLEASVPGRTERCARGAANEPAPWIACIAELVRSGQNEAALEELASFKLRYPQYPLPSELSGLTSASGGNGDAC